MILYQNMTARVTLGRAILKNISQFSVSESILEISDTAKITIPRSYNNLVPVNGRKTILDHFKVGDKVTIDAGYYQEGEERRDAINGRDAINRVSTINRVFTGYVSEIGSDVPLVVSCEDETWPLRQNSWIKSYKQVTLKQLLKDIMPGLTVECPDVNLGRFMVDNESSFKVLQRIQTEYALYSRLRDGILRVNLRDMLEGGHEGRSQQMVYTINPKTSQGNLVKKNELVYKRKEDFKLRVIITAVLPNGVKKEVKCGSLDTAASELKLTYPGTYTNEQLTNIGNSVYNNRCYDGYTGSITGFGTPCTHAGDILALEDKDEPGRSGSYLIEKVEVTYDENSGYSRKNTLGYKVASK